MTKKTWLGRAGACMGGTALALLVGCSNPLGHSQGAPTVVCAMSGGRRAATVSCTISKNFPSEEQTSLTNSCTNGGGSIVSSCPTASLVGCLQRQHRRALHRDLLLLGRRDLAEELVR